MNKTIMGFGVAQTWVQILVLPFTGVGPRTRHLIFWVSSFLIFFFFLILLFFLKKNILAALGLSCGTRDLHRSMWDLLVVARGNFFFFFFSCGMQTLSCSKHVGSSSLSRDRTRAPCIGSTESYPLDHQGSPSVFSSLTQEGCCLPPVQQFLGKAQFHLSYDSLGSHSRFKYLGKRVWPGIVMEGSGAPNL